MKDILQTLLFVWLILVLFKCRMLSFQDAGAARNEKIRIVDPSRCSVVTRAPLTSDLAPIDTGFHRRSPLVRGKFILMCTCPNPEGKAPDWAAAALKTARRNVKTWPDMRGGLPRSSSAL